MQRFLTFTSTKTSFEFWQAPGVTRCVARRGTYLRANFFCVPSSSFSFWLRFALADATRSSSSSSGMRAHAAYARAAQGGDRNDRGWGWGRWLCNSSLDQERSLTAGSDQDCGQRDDPGKGGSPTGGRLVLARVRRTDGAHRWLLPLVPRLSEGPARVAALDEHLVDAERSHSTCGDRDFVAGDCGDDRRVSN